MKKFIDLFTKTFMQKTFISNVQLRNQRNFATNVRSSHFKKVDLIYIAIK